MRTNRRYTRVRSILTDDAVPRLANGGIALCHGCQRAVYFAGGFLTVLMKRLEYGIKAYRPEGTCARCGSTKLYFIQTRNITRCTSCRLEWTANKGTARASGKKPHGWYDKILALRAQGMNPYRISKELGTYDAKSVYDFLRRVEVTQIVAGKP